jgi:thioredoxin-dependent peroxiredoxin
MAAKKKTATPKPPVQQRRTKLATKAQAKPAAKAQAKPAAKAQAKPAAKAQAKPAAKAQAKPAAKAQAKPAAKAQAKPAIKPPALNAKLAKAPATRAAKLAAASEPLVKKVKRAATQLVRAATTAAGKVLGAGAPVEAGSAAPSFELTNHQGELVSSSSLAGAPYLLYFYPKDDTPGCTKEACDIRDNFGRFGQRGVRVLGVSPDSTQSHAKFGKKYGLPFTLLSDPDKTLAMAYGVWALKQNYGKEYMGIVRSTFLVGADGTIKKAYRGVKVNGHIDAVLSDASELL